MLRAVPRGAPVECRGSATASARAPFGATTFLATACSSSPSPSSSARSCSSWCSRSSRRRSCRGSAAPLRSGPPASCSSRPRSSPATSMPTRWCAGSSRAAQVRVARRAAAALARRSADHSVCGMEAGGAENPSWLILGLLAVTIGAPYFLLSTTSPLVQAWFARARPGESPYRLFALSNLASMLALARLPVPARAVVADAHAGDRLVAGLRAFRRAVRGRGLDEHRPAARTDRPSARARKRDARDRARFRSRADRRAAAALVHAGGDGLAAAARRVQSHHAGHRVGAAAVDRTARHLPADVHSLLRRGGLVPARPHARAGSPWRSAPWRGRSPIRSSSIGSACISASSAPDSSSRACSATASSRG